MYTTQIEQQLTILLRRVQRIHFTTSAGDVEMDRSAYGILCRLVDEGPQRLGSLAQAFGLDPSTITRQVQSLEQTGWVVRHADPTDRRAALLDVTEKGSSVLLATRERRREWLKVTLRDWTPQEMDEFGRLIEKFNHSIEQVVEEWESGTKQNGAPA